MGGLKKSSIVYKGTRLCGLIFMVVLTYLKPSKMVKLMLLTIGVHMCTELAESEVIITTLLFCLNISVD